jgi:hypothetical protein
MCFHLVVFPVAVVVEYQSFIIEGSGVDGLFIFWWNAFLVSDLHRRAVLRAFTRSRR